jgi:hypothetical protein
LVSFLHDIFLLIKKYGAKGAKNKSSKLLASCPASSIIETSPPKEPTMQKFIIASIIAFSLFLSGCDLAEQGYTCDDAGQLIEPTGKPTGLPCPF